ncbi:exonuclease domain-containing protein [Streptomyces sp. NBC_00338]|uniref:exonuclease domain-containing protein n=1 Tax=Streptomyces sp. NBC_00338 TaxID=2975715 RepID=UPI00224D0BE6|nr:exonuclease domain-containing protein [Streptomyces sp. NBC_00338]MCX5138363.1 exonuclease domain-containing protein [Streptomyces sp. NBC_00338]MCX5145152.1 exonuclease domain-containing protein [Streptomyces sp. NBC_00338]
MTWHLGRMAGFDIESTGTDPETARIVTACIVQVGGQQPTVAANWLTDVDGEDIPAGAAAVHGISTEKARTDGVDLRQAVEEISAALAQVIVAGVPVVAMNARYDLSLLDREIQRFGFDPLPGGPVIDPLVLDKHVDTYRAGKRTLTHLCQHYQVKLDAAHSADADAVAACRVAWRQAAQYSELAAMTLDELHAAQIGWAAEQAAGLQAHFRKKDPEAVVEGAWPLIPRQRETTS